MLLKISDNKHCKGNKITLFYSEFMAVSQEYRRQPHLTLRAVFSALSKLLKILNFTKGVKNTDAN